jgi:beta-alanine--pyruvate transaminase
LLENPMSFAPIDTDPHRLCRPAHGRRLARRALDALHRQPPVQGQPAHDRGGQGAYFTDSEGRKIFDGLSGLWCSGLGHGRREIAEAVAGRR